MNTTRVQYCEHHQSTSAMLFTVLEYEVYLVQYKLQILSYIKEKQTYFCFSAKVLQLLHQLVKSFKADLSFH